MEDPGATEGWRFVRFGLLVTGTGESEFLPKLFRCLAKGDCHVEVVRKVGQLSPITSPRRTLPVTGTAKSIPSRDEEIGLAARSYLQLRRKSHEDSYVLLIDDLEGKRAPQVHAVYARYRLALDTMLTPLGLQAKTSVHFLVNMLEAYYLADTRAVNEVTGAQLVDFEGDVESISHPKGVLKQQIKGFDEIHHGREIIARLNVPHILSRPETCASLRTIFGWLTKALRRPFTEKYRLIDGRFHPVTQPQIDLLD